MTKVKYPILYVSRGNVPSCSANSIQVMKMSEAFSRNYKKFKLLIASPVIPLNPNFSFKEWYGVSSELFLKKIFCSICRKYPYNQNSIPYFFKYIVRFYLMINRKSFVFTRDIGIAKWSSFMKIPFVIELHNKFDVDNASNLKCFSDSNLFIKMIVISPELKKYYSKYIEASKIEVLEDGVDVLVYDSIISSKEELRAKLNICMTGYEYLGLFTGHLYKDRGIEDIYKVASQKTNILFLMVGGWPEDVASRIKEVNDLGLRNVLFIGHRPHSEMPLYQKAADFLLIPYSKKLNTVDIFSPLKLFEYMASRTPVIASRLDRIMDVLDESNGFICEPDSSDSLSSTISDIISDLAKANEKADIARQDVLKYSWDSRVQKILSFINRGD